MRRPTRMSVMLALTGVLTSVLTLVPTGTASAAEAIPTLKWPAVSVGRLDSSLVASSNGDITTPCAWVDGGTNLKTYNSSGKLVRQLNRTSVIDGVPNCIYGPIVDKNGTLYGIPSGKVSSGEWLSGPNLLAYSGNTLRWKYPVRCSQDPVVGADGNIYVTTSGSGGLHLIGLTPGVASGKKQPAKVLDIKVDSNTDCSTMVYAYKDGLILHGQLGGKAPRYYSYGGKYLGQATIGDIWSEKTNALGQLFVSSYVTGGFRSASVSMYDPRTGAVAWTTSASTPGSNVQGISIVPLSSGGVLARIKEQKMASPGVPTTPVEYAYTLATINAAGQKIKAVTLPNSDSSGNAIVGTYLSAESNGKVVVTRVLNVKTRVSRPTTVPAFSFGVYNPVAGTWGYQTIMQGDIQKKGGPSGYTLDWTNEQQVVTLANDTIYVGAHCSNNCSSTTQKLYPIKVTGLGMDYPRGVVLNANTQAQPAPVPYVALGDSYSSGEGDPPFIPGTAEGKGKDNCHRSYLAYSELTSMDPHLGADLNQGGFWACSGSQTEDVLTDRGTNNVLNNEATAQWKHLNKNTGVVTITIGGNDIGFLAFGSACFWSECDSSTAIYKKTLRNINTLLPGRLKTTYEKILAAAPNAQVYVLGYPYVVGVKKATDPYDLRCPYLYDGRSPWGDAQGVRSIIYNLDTAIGDEVTAVRLAPKTNNARLHYVNVNAKGSPFAGHGICDSGESYFNNIDTVGGAEAYIFHPNDLGQPTYAGLAERAIAAG